MAHPQMVEFIYTEERRGTGREGDPFRLCPQLWTKDGRLVAEQDMDREVFNGGNATPSF